MKRLAIISHTEHYINANNQIVGLSSTVNEINHLLQIFDEIYHLAMLHDGEAPKNTMPYCSKKIRFVEIPRVGGKSFKSKLSILTKAPKTINIIRKVLRNVDYFQFRAPTGIGLYLIPYLTLFSNKAGWFKYAGNWKQKNAPFNYKFQKWLLINQKRSVTINGVWKGQSPHCLSFENPCISQQELNLGLEIRAQKEYDAPFSLCFVGRLEPEKGMDVLLKALGELSKNETSKIKEVFIVGFGEHIEYYKAISKAVSVDVKFCGFLSRDEVIDVYKKCQFFILPSKSEGFPKVISESMNYGCIPVVNDISALGQYIVNKENGFMINNNLSKLLGELVNLSQMDLRNIVIENRDLLHKFTYKYYNNRIQKEIIEKTELIAGT